MFFKIKNTHKHVIKIAISPDQLDIQYHTAWLGHVFARFDWSQKHVK
jgi:hypothetical protein